MFVNACNVYCVQWNADEMGVTKKKNMFSHSSAAFSHVESFGFICSDYKISISEISAATQTQ